MIDSDTTQPPHLCLVTRLLHAIADYSKTTGFNATGNSVIQNGTETPIVVMYATYGNGNWMCWFADDGKLHLYTFVNDTVKRVLSSLTSEVGPFQKAIDSVRIQLEGK